MSDLSIFMAAPFRVCLFEFSVNLRHLRVTEGEEARLADGLLVRWIQLDEYLAFIVYGLYLGAGEEGKMIHLPVSERDGDHVDTEGADMPPEQGVFDPLEGVAVNPRLVNDDAKAEGKRTEVGRDDPREDHGYGGRNDIGGFGFLREKERDRDDRGEDTDEGAGDEGHELGGAAVADSIARGGFLDGGVSHGGLLSVIVDIYGPPRTSVPTVPFNLDLFRQNAL